jgi:hypothetical protein
MLRQKAQDTAPLLGVYLALSPPPTPHLVNRPVARKPLTWSSKLHAEAGEEVLHAKEGRRKAIP